MGGVPRPILTLVAIGLALAAILGFAWGIAQSDHRAGTNEPAPIAANLPADVVIKDAQPLAPPPPPPPIKAKAPDDEESDQASDEEPVPLAPRGPHSLDEAPPPEPPGPPSQPGGQLPADLPPI